MKPFMDEDFLLQSEPARRLFHEVAESLPIIDYHCHLNPQEVAEDRRFGNLAEAWLHGDHYKWRAMRIHGVEEKLVTGPADDYERFLAWAGTVPALIGNPLYHWTHLELQRYFDIHETLSPATAKSIWERANAVLAREDRSARGLIRASRVRVICTTDDPADDLRWHKAIAADPTAPCRVLPAFRPDRALSIEKPDWAAYLAALGQAGGREIKGFDDLLAVLDARMEYFHGVGCRLSDHGFTVLPFERASVDEAAAALQKALAGQALTQRETDAYKTVLLQHLARGYAKRDWAMQLHVGATRNNNTARFRTLGPDTGFDAVADSPLAANLSALLDSLEVEGTLPRTILYTLNPKDNYVIAALTGAFGGAGIGGKVQFGSAWWFADHKQGMEQQMTDLANLGMLSRFVGMLTDSRSFLSYTRHEYFRRILCNLVGSWVERGECPNDRALLDAMMEGICYRNAERYFGF